MSWSSGVTVVTTESDGELCGMTLNSLTSVSLHPRLLLICLGKGSRTAKGVLARGAFVVNLLAEDQEHLSERFSVSGGNHFDGLACTTNEHGLPELPATLGALTCSVENLYSAGDHLIVLGRALKCTVREGAPLLFFRGRYGRCAAAA